MSAFSQGLEKTKANHVALTPLGFLEHTAQVYPQRTSIISEKVQFTWAQTYERCRRLGSALHARGVKKLDTVSIMAHNTPAYIEAYYGVPMIGAVLNVLNTRLDAEMVAFMLDHSDTSVVMVDRELSSVVHEALKLMKCKPLVIDIDDPCYDGAGDMIGEVEYEVLLTEGDPEFSWSWPADEWDPITINYTSGTTGDPKGVVYNHRGAYLNTMGNGYAWNMNRHPVYLWTLPMFHASGWCFPWVITMMAGTHVCLRKVRADQIFNLIEEHNVTHMCAAPVVVNTLINAPDDIKKSYDRTINVMIAGSAPPAAVLQALDGMGFAGTHVYGATESYGPAISCEWHEEWNDLPEEERATLKARQGVRYPMLEEMIIGDPETCEEVPWDGETIGECLMRGNIIMSGYLKNPETTKTAFKGGWYHSGDLCVRHPNGYIEVKDRLKDIIISGGENIATLEVESVIYRHPAVLEAAVVAMPHEKWGETPCAFIELKPDADNVTEADIIAHCRKNMAAYKTPRRVIFEPLIKSATGKIQKFALREKACALAKQEGSQKEAA